MLSDMAIQQFKFNLLFSYSAVIEQVLMLAITLLEAFKVEAILVCSNWGLA
jgi:hypothetical protein